MNGQWRLFSIADVQVTDCSEVVIAPRVFDSAGGGVFDHAYSFCGIPIDDPEMQR